MTPKKIRIIGLGWGIAFKDFKKITNPNDQITNKLQYQMSNEQNFKTNVFVILELFIWYCL